MATKDVVELCAADLLSKVTEAVSGDQHLYIYGTDVLLAQKGSVNYPMVGVLYAGMISQDTLNNDKSVFIRFTIQIMYGELSYENRGQEDKSVITGYLRDIRDCIKDTISPTGHKWKFVGEAPAPLDSEVLVYSQSWMVAGTIT